MASGSGYCPGVDLHQPDRDDIDVKAVATQLLGQVSDLADEMLRYLVTRIPETVEDDELRGLTLGSCSSNIESVLSMVRHGIDVAAAEAPVTALEHARAMASRGYSVDVMLRFYRLGHEFFTEKLSEAVPLWIEDPSIALRTFVELEAFGFRYIDLISSAVADEYVAELDRRQHQERVERADLVRALVAGERINQGRAERVLRHRLTGVQVGFVCWSGDRGVDLEKVARRVASALGAETALVMQDGPLAVQGWVAVASGAAAGAPSLPADAIGSSAHVAIGSAHSGVPGFRTSHHEALRARRVVELSGRAAPSLTRFPDVALVDLLSRDVEAAKAFVQSELGELARDDTRQRDERTALLAVLDAQGSLMSAARTIDVHRNTVLQRVRRAEQRRGLSASARVAELHAALRLCEVLGASVLSDRVE
ncbi:DNA-binding PucR family transcriptional regulator [Williamsia limnetica]|uniref:DNA-binding PucR family transcriptional regulator n=1 Tax=Williamsia limnetica TaxID=882452 RepID=A0A318RFG0_WILLI|nr:DNA-binding PucR family transcriptional regulator [Williamsia limnetica]